MKAVVFDLDGTLLDTIGDIANSMNYALKCYDIPPCTEDEVKSFVGNGLKMALARAIAKKAERSVDENDQNLMFSLMENYYHKHPIEKTKPYDGIPMLLSLLDKSGVPYGVLSNKDDDLAKMIIPHFFPSHPFLFFNQFPEVGFPVRVGVPMHVCAVVVVAGDGINSVFGF